MIRTIFCTIVGICFIIFCGLTCYQIDQDYWQAANEHAVSPVPDKLITPSQLQTLLQGRGYDIGPHGVDSRIGPDTISAWDKAVGDQFAREYFE